MARWVYRPNHPNANSNGMVDINEAYSDQQSLGLYVISDEMEPTRHMADGRYFTSKAKFRENTKAHGCYEIGNEIPTMLEPRKRIELSREKRRDDIRRTIYELRNGIRSSDS